MELSDFAQRLHGIDVLKTTADRAIALLWLIGRSNPAQGATPHELAQVLEDAGYPDQNVSRLRRQLTDDRRTAKAGSDGFRLRPNSRLELEPVLSPTTGPRQGAPTDSLIPRSLATATRRTYLQKVIHQVNASYDAELFDCTAVMMRRLIETLIIELFEARRIEAKIKDASGQFFMLDTLLAKLDSEPGLNLGRNSKTGLRKLKELGDKSAHNRRFNAQQSDIDQLSADVRTAAEELMHMAGLLPAATSAA